LDNEHLREFSDALYGVLNQAEIKSFSELETDWFQPAIRMIQSLGNLDRTTRKNMGKVIGVLFDAVKNNINTLLPAPEKKPPGQIGS
jgi:sorbitol-specific phosphotransferase system component IIBC